MARPENPAAPAAGAHLRRKVRTAMKRFLQCLVASTTLAVTAAPVAQSIRELGYDANADVLTLPSYGEVAGVATNSRGQVFVYARTGHAVATLGDERTFYHGGSRLFQFDASGKFVKETRQDYHAGDLPTLIR